MKNFFSKNVESSVRGNRANNRTDIISYCILSPLCNENKCSGTKPPLIGPPFPKKEVKFDL